MIIKLKLISSYFSINAPKNKKTKNAEKLLVSGIWMNLSKFFQEKTFWNSNLKKKSLQLTTSFTYNTLKLQLVGSLPANLNK